ncbi:MAG TPA: hypothetical protein VFH15_14655 [Pyrinomonadaceae bacterium]|nr:hypothetical protein [Pyrinomonadaceae bacterium]
MNCQSFENIVNDLAREQLIEAALREEALHHSSDCATCAARLSDERSLTASLRALALEMNSASAPERVESFLLAAFNEQQLSWQARPKRWNYLTTAAAAVLLVAFGIGVAAWNLRTPLKPAVENVVASAPHVEATVPVVNGSKEASLSPRVKPEAVPNSKVRRRAVRPRATNAQLATTSASLSETEVVSDFMPIGYVNSASLQDGGSVVRVELPRSTIVSMGFAVNMDRYSERVKADVLMGADGLARAIRFVQ